MISMTMLMSVLMLREDYDECYDFDKHDVEYDDDVAEHYSCEEECD